MVAEQLTSIRYRNVLFGVERNSSSLELNAHGAETGALQKTRSQYSMHRNTTADRLVNKGLDFIRQRIWYANH